MPFNSGTGITDQIDMLDKLTEVVTSRYLASVDISAGGGGASHAVGDIIQITATGSTSTIVAQLEVTAVTAGAIDTGGVRVYRSGAYTVDPTDVLTNAQSATSGSGTGATFILTMAAPTWAVNRRTQEASTAVFAAAGTGYTVGDTLTLVDDSGTKHDDTDGTGTPGVVATFNVDSISGGGGTGPVLTVSVVTAGNYSEVPANPVTVTGGTGSACTLTVTWADGTKANNDGQVCMLQGEGLSGTDEIHVIIKTYTMANGINFAFNWAAIGCTGYNAGLLVHEQTGVNTDDPAHQLDPTDGGFPASATEGGYFVLKDNDADPDISWWINHNGRRIIIVCKVEDAINTEYSSLYMGFLNQFGTETEYPYPLATLHGTSRQNAIWGETNLLQGGITESIMGATGSDEPAGPCFARSPAGVWNGFCAERSSTASSKLVENEYCVYPFYDRADGISNSLSVVALSWLSFADALAHFIEQTGVTGTADILLRPTPGTGDAYFWMVSPIIMKQGDTAGFPTGYQLLGEVDGVYWFQTGGEAVVSEDRFEQGTSRYLVFSNGNRTWNWSYFALDED